MKFDLTKTYRDRALKNLPHRRRLKEIYRIIDREGLSGREGLSYADFGCASGYVTDLVTRELKPAAAFGFCHSDGIETGRKKYPHIEFGFVELTEPSDIGQYDFCTCLETLEHVGNIEIAMENLCRAAGGGVHS